MLDVMAALYAHSSFYGGPRKSPSLNELIEELTEDKYGGERDESSDEVEELSF